MFYFYLTDRRSFGDMMSADGLARLTVSASLELEDVLDRAPRGHSALAVWSLNPRETGQLPGLLICPDGEEEDWAAWITTFGPRIRPFSAYFRLAAFSDLKNMIRELRIPRLGDLSWPVAGLVLGEVLAASRLPDKALDSVPATACASTLSFAMFRAAAVYAEFRRWPALIGAWEAVREITHQRPRAIDGRSVARVCATVIEAAGLDSSGALVGWSDSNLAGVCRELISSPDLMPLSLRRYSHFAAIEERMNGSREDRVVALADFMRELISTDPGMSEMNSFMLGYLTSRIAPGSVRHSSVLEPMSQHYPSALLWYGFCAGMSVAAGGRGGGADPRRSSLDLPLSSRRVIRDLLRPEPILGPPNCDISAIELLALSRTGGESLAGLIATTQGTVIVELTPGVWTAINSPSRGATSRDGEALALRDRSMRLTLGECIEQLHKLYTELGTDTSGDESGQRRLFPSRRRKK